MASVRLARAHEPAERDRLYDICARTGAAGGDARPLLHDPLLLGDVYLGLYLDLEPEHCLVLADADDVAIGYAVGTADTAALERRAALAWWPRVRARRSAPVTPMSALEEHLLDQLRAPARAEPSVLASYPAHLHIDLLPHAQGGGNGRRLICALLDTFRAAGAAGAHLGVDPDNARALGFYRHLGFTDLEVDGATVLGVRL